MTTFKSALGLATDQSPFPWQERLLERLIHGVGKTFSLDIPTGLGKTSVMAAWLVARAQNANLPRRLIYVVDRRAVVDQATEEAIRLRKWVHKSPDLKQALGILDHAELPISTLRGQFADNREWLSSPTLPAIVVGTVDMVGSRLLFEGYGVSRKMRPYHAGFLGADSLFVLDEAHLVPPFEALLNTIVNNPPSLSGESSAQKSIPRSILLSLSATGRSGGGDVIQVDEETDLKHLIAGKRLNAVKQLTFCEASADDERKLAERLADEAWQLCGEGTVPMRIIVFCNSRATAVSVQETVTKKAKADKKQERPERKIEAQLFVGSRRVRERQDVAQWLKEYGFIAGADTTCEVSSFVFATSAGEVGVDLDADHMVSDLVPFERMIQRLGRVNRRGGGEAEVRIVLQSDQPNAKEKPALKKALAKSERQRNATDHGLVKQFDLAPRYRAAIQALPKVANSDAYDGSPEALRQLKLKAIDDETLRNTLQQATTPEPLRPELTRPILDSWSMTSLEKHSARPNVAPWLRGWIDDEPQTTVVWRTHLPTRSNQCSDTQIKDFFEAAPVHLTEKLETSSNDVFQWIVKRAEKIDKVRKAPKKQERDDIKSLPKNTDTVLVLLDQSGGCAGKITLGELLFPFDNPKAAKRAKDHFARELWNKTVVTDARMGGISSGLLDESADFVPAPAADGPEDWMSPDENAPASDPIPPFRVREVAAEATNAEAKATPAKTSRNWKPCFRMPIQKGDEEESSSFLVVERYSKTVTSEESRSTSSELSLATHLQQTEAEAATIAKQLDLPPELAQVLKIAARNHDHGKRTDRWQNAFSAPLDGRPFAKTKGPLRKSLLEGYRHEFGSLPHVTEDAEFKTLSEDLQDLTLHLVAAHHGFARPVIRVDGCDGAPSTLEKRATEVALRFARTQKRWGPWGLAWLESLLRAADQRASAMAEDEATGAEVV